MSAAQDPPRRAAASARSRAAERARLEARLADSKQWQSLQRLDERRSGKKLMDAIEVLSERERLERELIDQSEDYRSWLALSGQGRRANVAAPSPAEFKTRVRVKTPARASDAPMTATSIADPVPTAITRIAPPPVAVSATSGARADTTSPAARRGRSSAEEAAVIIVRRSKDGTVTRTELPPLGTGTPLTSAASGAASDAPPVRQAYPRPRET